MSHVMCHMYFSSSFLLGQGGEAYPWRVCYQQAYPVYFLNAQQVCFLNLTVHCTGVRDMYDIGQFTV